MLRSIVLELEGDIDFVRKNFLGYQTYSFLINQLKKIDKEKASFYHQKNKQKPFSLTAPFVFDERIFTRINLLNDEVFNLFLTGIFNQKEIVIGKSFNLKKVYLAPEKSLPFKIKSMVKNYSKDEDIRIYPVLTLNFLSPTIFKVGSNYEIIPNFSLIKNSFEQKQKQIYGEIIYNLPEFLITEIRLNSKEVNIDPFGSFVGSVGFVKIKLKEKNSHILALDFFGLGLKTTMGLGSIVFDIVE